MKELLEYARARRYFAALLALLGGLCAGLAALYGATGSQIGYGALLCLAVVAAATLWDALVFCRRQRVLRRLEANIALRDGALPAPLDPREEAYQRLLLEQRRQQSVETAQLQNRLQEQQDYIALWAHQIKTPIAAQQLLLRGVEEQQGRALRRELFRIEQYVESVLQFMRLESESMDFVLRPCLLETVVRAAARKYASAFIEARLTLSYTPGGEKALTDEKWLTFVVEQLFSNAVKYTPAGGSVTVRVEPGPTLVVEDTGIGIAPEDLPRVTEKGFTGYNGRMGQKSTGIGLYLCKRILNKLGHTLRLASEPGRGTTVSIGLEAPELAVE